MAIKIVQNTAAIQEESKAVGSWRCCAACPAAPAAPPTTPRCSACLIQMHSLKFPFHGDFKMKETQILNENYFWQAALAGLRLLGTASQFPS